MAARLIKGSRGAEPEPSGSHGQGEQGGPGADGPGRGASRRALLAGAVAGAAGLAVGTEALPAAAAQAAPARLGGAGAGLAPGGAVGSQNHDFVTARGGKFHVGGRSWRFGGTNTYYLHQQSHYMIDSALNDAAAMSLSVVRAWAFADGSGKGYTPLQPEPYVYDNAAFDPLDYAIYKAGQLGLRLVLGLTNNWPDYGGMAQYVTWFLGLPDDSFGDMVNHDKFYTTKSIQDCYRAYVKHVLTRHNRYTGLRYNEDPTIMTWELANEPRARSDKTGQTLLTWVRETSAYFKRLAPRQLVAVGDEGFYGDPANSDYPYSNFEGDRWKDFVALPTIDYGTVHLYPQGWGENPASKPGTDPVAWGTKWITDHISDGAALHKPVVIEEYGLALNASQGVPDEAARDAGYKAWTDAVLNNGGAGDQFWLLTSRVDDGSFYPNYDGYRIIWDNDPSNSTNSTAQLLSAHAKTMAAAS
jgi:mannan endo-1,4-beta-mannosidase